MSLFSNCAASIGLASTIIGLLSLEAQELERVWSASLADLEKTIEWQSRRSHCQRSRRTVTDLAYEGETWGYMPHRRGGI